MEPLQSFTGGRTESLQGVDDILENIFICNYPAAVAGSLWASCYLCKKVDRSSWAGPVLGRVKECQAPRLA